MKKFFLSDDLGINVWTDFYKSRKAAEREFMNIYGEMPALVHIIRGDGTVIATFMNL